ncbi:MAG: HPr(Ser) kinase/phosphatase [Pseudomonadota bacterium]|nr:MAG: HPr(Ser) kinase/phosphatase [Pseudomonadota bacterium]
MPHPLTVQTLIDHYHETLGLQWIAGRAGASRVAMPADARCADATAAGHLNLIRPSCVQILGRSELEYLAGLGKNSHDDAIDALFGATPALVIVADGETVPGELAQRAEASNTPLLASPVNSVRLLEHLRHYLASHAREHTTLHGVFLEVLGVGVLLAGPSGIGKSELALELVSRGHRLVADDAPQFTRTAPERVEGACPTLLRDFLEVRGLGVLNIREMFGDNAVLAARRLQLVITLQTDTQDQDNTERLNASRYHREILGVTIPEAVLPVAPGRNLAVIVEAAVRNHLLLSRGYNAARDLSERQQEKLAGEPQ